MGFRDAEENSLHYSTRPHGTHARQEKSISYFCQFYLLFRYKEFVHLTHEQETIIPTGLKVFVVQNTYRSMKLNFLVNNNLNLKIIPNMDTFSLDKLVLAFKLM